MIVVSDTGPIHYILLIGAVDVLPALFGRVLVPEAVYEELRAPGAPKAVREWIEAAPAWLGVRFSDELAIDEVLDLGEREALSLAVALGADLLLADDSAARDAARRHGIMVAGTVGILERAATHGLTDLPSAFDRLSQTNFRVSEQILDDVLARDAARRRSGRAHQETD